LRRGARNGRHTPIRQTFIFKSENHAQARSFFDRALALDPDNLDALIGTATVDAGVAASYVTDKAPRAAAAEATLTKVPSLATKSAAAHPTMGLVLVITNRGAQGIAECERALSLDPNLAAAHALMGLAKLANGRAAEAEGHAREVLRLSPRDPAAYIWVAYIAAAKLFLGADEEAVGWYRRSIEINRNYPIAHLYLAAALEGLGRQDEAQAEAQTAHALNPYLTIRRFREDAYSDNPVFLSQRERFIEAMPKPGCRRDKFRRFQSANSSSNALASFRSRVSNRLVTSRTPKREAR
jgi:tetratricopeptide (TPR) repeat protein